MFDGKPPYAEIHPMRAIFMIPTKPPPSFKDPNKSSSTFIDFLSKCLVKNPSARATASELLQHEFIKNSKSFSILQNLIQDTIQVKAENEIQMKNETMSFKTANDFSITSSMESSRDTFNSCETELTLIYKDQNDDARGTIVSNKSMKDSFETIKSKEETFKRKSNTLKSIESPMGTMIINDEDEDDEEANNTFEIKDGGESQYKQFLENYEPKTLLDSVDNSADVNRAKNLIRSEVKMLESDKNYKFNLSCSDIQFRLRYLDTQMDDEIQKLKSKYEQKRQVILEAIELKRKNKNIF